MDIGSQADAYDNEYRGGRALRFSLNAKAALANGTFECLVSAHKKCMIVCFPVYFEIYLKDRCGSDVDPPSNKNINKNLRLRGDDARGQSDLVQNEIITSLLSLPRTTRIWVPPRPSLNQRVNCVA